MNPSDPASRDLRIFAFDRRGRLAWFSGPTGGTTRIEYDDDRRAVSIMDPAGRKHELTWDYFQTLVETRDTETGEHAFSYEHHPSVMALTHPRSGRGITTYTFDSSCRLIHTSDDAREEPRS